MLKNQHPTGVVYAQLRSSITDRSQTFCVCILQEKEEKRRIVLFLRLPPQKGEIGRAQEKEASIEHYRSCYQLRMLKNIDGSVFSSDVGKRDFAGAGHLLRCCAQSRVF